MIDKPAGITSSGVVLRVKKLLKRKIGHGGTLDPQATGLLLIFVGKATKLASFFYPLEKRYVAKAKFGITTDTQDIWGNTQSEKDAASITHQKIEEMLPRFIGKIEQTPPMVSAIHHQGRRLYELAREGKVVERQKRSVIIHELSLLDFVGNGRPEAIFSIRCSGGTYIRTLFFDLGEALGVGASLSFLRRVGIGEFRIEKAITLTDFKEKAKNKEGESVITSIQDSLYFMDEAVIDDPEKAMNGTPFKFEGKTEYAKICLKDGTFIGIGKNEKGFLGPIKIIITSDDLL